MQPSPRSFSEQLQKRCSVRRYIEMQILSSHNRLIPPARCAARNIFSSVSCCVELCLFVPGLGQLTAKFFDIKNRGGATGFLACVKRHVAAAARKAHATRVAPHPLVGKTMLRRGPLRDNAASLGAIFVPCAWRQRTGNNRTTVMIREFFFFLSFLKHSQSSICKKMRYSISSG